MDAFYLPDGDRFVSTELTRGPWDPGSQHAGPPAALLARAVEGHSDREDLLTVRVTYEILRPVPIAPLGVRVEPRREGRQSARIDAVLEADGTAIMRVSALRLRVRTVDLPEGLARDPAPPGPENAREEAFFPTGHDVGYHTAMDARFLTGSFLEQGPATVWMRMRVPLVAGEEPTPLARVLVAADAGNGVSAVLDYRRYTFANPDLTVSLHRPPVGEWVCLDARTTPEPTGTGLAESVIHDRDGPVGRGLQSLLIAERAAP